MKHILLFTLYIPLIACSDLSFRSPTVSNTEDPVISAPVESPVQEAPITPQPEEEYDEVKKLDSLSCSGSYARSIHKVTPGASQTISELEHLFDGDKTNTSVWNTANSNELVIELKQATLVKHLVLSWANPQTTYYYEVESSLDGTNWQPILTSAQSKKGYIVPELISFDSTPATANYLKLSLLGNELDDSSALVEIDIYGCDTSATHNIELIDWYLSVQTDIDNNGKADSIKETSLANGYQDPRFFNVNKDGGLTFTSSVQGYKTSTNTKYVRSELREMLRRGDTSYKTQGVNKNNWVFSSAPAADLHNAGGIDGKLSAELAVNHVTKTGDSSQIGRVIIGQIHANDDEPVRLYYRKLPNNKYGSVYFAHEQLGGDDTYHELLGSRNDNAPDLDIGIPLNEKFKYQIEVVGNNLTVSVTKLDGESYSKTIDMSGSGYDEGGQYMYFKAGVYNQNNSGDLHDYVQATFYQIDNQHD